MPLLGAHVDSSGGLHLSFERAAAMGAEAIQIHPTPPGFWGSPKLDEARISTFKEAAAKHGNPPFYFHAVYLINMRGSGMVSTQALDDAETRRNNAQSDLAGAKARAVQARQQLQRTEARAPFDGIVSDRKVSAGDTAQIGKELLKVIDPSSMRFEGMVSADNIGDVKPGQPVGFRVNGYGEQQFSGKVRRVNPSANATTRQVEVLVDFAGEKQPKLAGLYAEGRIEAASRTSLTIAATALVRDGDKASVWRIKDKKLQKAAVVIGERDIRSGDFVVVSGVAEGDSVIRYPAATLKDGQAVELSAAVTAPLPEGSKSASAAPSASGSVKGK